LPWLRLEPHDNPTFVHWLYSNARPSLWPAYPLL